MSFQLATILLSTNINNSKVISSGSKNNKKSAKSNFTKTMYRAEELSFLTFDTRQVLT